MSRWRWFGMVLLLGLLGAGCLSSPERTRRPEADFSRGIALAQGMSGTYTAWITGDTLEVILPQGDHLRWLAYPLEAELWRQGPPTPDAQDLAVSGEKVYFPQFFPLAASGRGWLTFVTQEASGAQLWAGCFEDGHWVNPPSRVSPADQAVRAYQALLTPQGDLLTVWRPKGQATLWARWGLREPAVPWAVQAQAWALAQTSASDVWLAWVTPEGDLYAAAVPSPEGPRAAVRLVQGVASGGGTVDALRLTALPQELMVTWEVAFHSGLQSGTSSVAYLLFAPEHPEEPSPVQRLQIPLAEHPTSVALTAGPPGWQRLAPMAAPGRGSSFVADPWPVGLADGTALLAVSAYRWYRLDKVAQIAVVWLGATPKGYQAAAQTIGFSQDPRLLTLPQGQVLLWREGALGDRLFFATTLPQLRAVLNRFTWADFVTGGEQALVEGLTGLVWFPLAVLWLLPGGLVAGLGVALGAGDATTMRGRLVFGLAFLFYQATKALFLPGLFIYAPFSAWWDLPGTWRAPLRVLVPLVIAGWGLGGGWVVLRRRQLTSVLVWYLLAATLDAVGTLLIYGVNFLGVLF